MISTSTVDLAFEVRDLLGLMQLQIAGLPPGWWLKSVLVDGEDAFDGHLFPVSGTIDGVVETIRQSRENAPPARARGEEERSSEAEGLSAIEDTRPPPLGYAESSPPAPAGGE